MAKKAPSPAPAPQDALAEEVSELRTEVANLRDHVRVTIEILDGIREDLQWVTQNGIELREPPSFRIPSPVLKGMALDPAGDDWGEKLVINHGLKSSQPASESSRHKTDEPAERPRSATPPPTVSATSESSPPVASPLTLDASTPPKPAPKNGKLF